jgi:uncharacterized protein (DUF983 family)
MITRFGSEIQLPKHHYPTQDHATPLVLILRCLACDSGYIIDGTLCPQVCQACGATLVLSQLWDLSTEPAPAGWAWHGLEVAR